MRHWRIGAWWLLLVAALPLFVPLALWTRRTALRLPPAAGPQHGLAGAEMPGEPLRLLLLGESTVAGVGVGQQQQALVGCLAQALAENLGRPVAWRACGENGITAGQACQRLLPQALDEPVDLALLVFGVNDTTHFSSLQAWQAALERMTGELTATGARVALSAVPPLQHFSALPWLLRQLFGARARQLDECLREVAELAGAQCCAVEVSFCADYLAEDGYHPSALGYRVWAQGLAAGLTRAASSRLAR